MREKKTSIFMILILFICSFSLAEDYPLQYYLKKVSSKSITMSSKEKTELLNQIHQLVEQIREVHQKLVYGIQSGDFELSYQEGRFWLSRLEQDQKMTEIAVQRVKLLRESPGHLVAALELYHSLKNLSINFNTYNNQLLFSASIGDLAPDIELWVDPVFYQLYLLPLAQSKGEGGKTGSAEKKPVPKVKKP